MPEKCCGALWSVIVRDEGRVRQGPYVLVLLNTGHAHRSNRLPAGWLLTTYRSLSRPFRKHVKRIVLARPRRLALALNKGPLQAICGVQGLGFCRHAQRIVLARPRRLAHAWNEGLCNSLWGTSDQPADIIFPTTCSVTLRATGQLLPAGGRQLVSPLSPEPDMQPGGLCPGAAEHGAQGAAGAAAAVCQPQGRPQDCRRGEPHRHRGRHQACPSFCFPLLLTPLLRTADQHLRRPVTKPRCSSSAVLLRHFVGGRVEHSLHDGGQCFRSLSCLCGCAGVRWRSRTWARASPQPLGAWFPTAAPRAQSAPCAARRGLAGPPSRGSRVLIFQGLLPAANGTFSPLRSRLGYGLLQQRCEALLPAATAMRVALQGKCMPPARPL